MNLLKTDFPPKEKPLMVYDGDCGFCKYWLVKWKKVSNTFIDFDSYQRVSHQFKDIPQEEFKKAVQLILINGEVYSGAAAAYYTYHLNGRASLLYNIYKGVSLFRWLSDFFYKKIARNRNAAFKLTKVVFGPDPKKSSKGRLVLFAVVLILIFLGITNTLLL